MNNIDFLKKQHLLLFEEKREAHTSLTASLYSRFISEKNMHNVDKWNLFGDFYLYFSKNFPAEIYDKERIVGTNWHWSWQRKAESKILPRNAGHFIADFSDFLKKGVSGKVAEIRNMHSHGESDAVLSGKEKALNAFALYIKSYADAATELALLSQGYDKKRLEEIAQNCAYIANNAPESFLQAIQLVWFVQCFLEMEAGAPAISFGRADDYLYPYYKKDIESKSLTPDEAIEIIMCFYIKVSEGNESTMLTVGGDKENELTSLFIEAQTRVDMRQPSVALRVSSSTGDEVFEKANNLVRNGGGMPAYFNDDIIIEGLKMFGADSKRAADYAITGCYEATLQGTFTNTVATTFNLYDSFIDFLNQKKTYADFEEFLKCYKEYFTSYYQVTLIPEFKSVADDDKNLVCPFASCVIEMDREYYLGINILGFGILADSLYVIKKLVFDEKYTTIDKLVVQAENDFDDDLLYNRIANLKEHYGSNSDESNLMAKDISEFIGRVILGHPVGNNVISYPALFCFTADIWHRKCGGMVNGRKRGELLSYGIMPCASPSHDDSLTDILLSCANVSAEYFPDGCPTMISLNKSDIEKYPLLKSLIQTFFKAGGYHLAVNTVDAQLLKEAKQNPSEHKDIMVKISGYSARFTSLCEEIQNAVIERAPGQ